MSKLRVMIVDDAVVIRRLVADVLSEDPQIEVVGSAANGRIALEMLPQVNPDLVTLDVEMPEMSGLATLPRLRKIYPHLPVIMFSKITSKGAAATLDALAAGANDYVTKPAVDSILFAMSHIRMELVPRVKALCEKEIARRNAVAVEPQAGTPVRSARAPRRKAPIEAIVIAVSTGGPNALVKIIPELPADLPVPVLIVQHMPALFTGLLAERLDQKSQLRVKEGVAGEVPQAGWVYIAPGDYHMTLANSANGPVIGLNQDPPENSCRPAADVLFRGAAATYGPGTLAVVLTGMGQDGLRGTVSIYEARGRIVVQDEATSVVWGMPGCVARARMAEQVIPLESIAAKIVNLVHASRPEAELSQPLTGG